MRKSHHVRQARADDWRAIADCFVSAGAAAWSEFLPDNAIRNLKPPDRWEYAVYKNTQVNNVLVVETEGRVIGFSIVRPSEDDDRLPLTGEIDAFYTHPHFWGMGAGTLLMEETIARAKEMGHRRLTLWTEERNVRPRRFYYLGGWREDGAAREREIHGTSIRELRYLKEF
jgi:GNAT superfamily N-acetyltransferase